MLCAEFCCLLRYRSTPIDNRAEHVENEGFDLGFAHVAAFTVVIWLNKNVASDSTGGILVTHAGLSRSD
jgi:hypothetical protein